jgi:hypothetical protein
MAMSGHARKLSGAQIRIPDGHLWSRIPLIAAVIGIVALGVTVALGRDDLKQFFYSYLLGYMFCLAIALGAMWFVLVHHITNAGWGIVVRRIAENVMGTFPLLALLFIPIALFGVDELFHWAEYEQQLADGTVQDVDLILEGKLPFLNKSFFLIRAAVYLAIWSGIALYFRRSSVAQDETGDHATSRRLRTFAAPGLILFALTSTFAAFDWLMALEPHWFSTVFGIYFFAGCIISIYAFLSVSSILLQKSGLMKDVITSEHYQDLGKMMFAFVVFWTYIAFSQFMLIWYANLPEETFWFEERWTGSWKAFTIFLGFGHFAVPFFFLMSRHIKRNRLALLAGGLWMLMIELADMYWLIFPSLHNHGEHPGVNFNIMSLTAVIGIFGLFFAVFAYQLNRDPLVPVKDPRLSESLAFENH